MAEEKIADIEKKVRQLEAMKGALQTLVRSCGRPGKATCPILEALEREDA